MIKKSVTYTDYNDDLVTEDFYFHASKSMLLDKVDFRMRLQVMATTLQGEKRDLTEVEVLDMISIIRELIEMSYGERSEDGKRFRQSPEIFRDFADSAAYDAMLFDLFKDTQKASEFMTGILPKDLLEAVDAEQNKRPELLGHLEKKQPEKPSIQTVPDVEVEDEEIARLRAELRAKLTGESSN